MYACSPRSPPRRFPSLNLHSTEEEALPSTTRTLMEAEVGLLRAVRRRRKRRGGEGGGGGRSKIRDRSMENDRRRKMQVRPSPIFLQSLHVYPGLAYSFLSLSLSLSVPAPEFREDSFFFYLAEITRFTREERDDKGGRRAS